MVAARVILGVGTSAGYPTAMVIVRRWAAEHESAATGGTLGALAIAAQVTSALGLPLGGLLAAAADWRITFFIHVPPVLLGVLMTGGALCAVRSARGGSRGTQARPAATG